MYVLILHAHDRPICFQIHSQTAQFRKWIEDSRVSQLDEETENMIVELRRKVARHRWKRAISAVRLSYKLSGGKAPKFEAPVAAPGCENENRFVDLNQMMSEVVRKQPKYFKEGSIMDNLIESGIEVVWFSDLTQNDVVYGVCCQREEKKVTVVFRGTVNSHNWSVSSLLDYCGLSIECSTLPHIVVCISFTDESKV